jgi:hypothetical protein
MARGALPLDSIGCLREKWRPPEFVRDNNMRLVKMRGPTAFRGLQFAGWDSTELLHKLQEATRTLDQLDNLRRFPSTSAASPAVTQLSAAERAQLRKETFDLATDLRAEMRRRDGL